MSETLAIRDPEADSCEQTLGEEIANSVSHGVGLLAALAAIPFLLVHASRLGRAGFTVGCAVFSAAIVMLYLASTLYHALPRGPAKHVFRVIEHLAIYVLIAGTYTPFTLGVLRGAWGWTLFGLIWGLTAGGTALKLIGGFRYPIVSGTLYVLMGWVVMIAARPMWLLMPHRGFLWILFGGLSYTGGVTFFAIDYRMRYSHFIWHLFVMAGTVLHFLAVYWYAA
jgi:hemolysin III